MSTPDQFNHESTDDNVSSNAAGVPVNADLCYPFEQLARGQIEVQITFQGQTYRLRKTRNGRLILTK